MRPTRNAKRAETKPSPPERPRAEHVLEQHRRKPHDPYWCLRVCEAIKPMDASRVSKVWADALARVIEHDPTWFVSVKSPEAATLGLYTAPLALLARVERQITIRDRSRDCQVKGLLWVRALRFRKPPEVERLRHAADYLRRVAERHRTGSFYEDLCHALEHVDYDELKGLFSALLHGCNIGSATSQLIEQGHVVFVLVAAARAGDWTTYEVYRGRFRDGNDAHRDCEVWSCDGLRELAMDRNEHLAGILKAMTERAANVKFLGGQADTAFVNALIERGRFGDECRAYLEVTRRG